MDDVLRARLARHGEGAVNACVMCDEYLADMFGPLHCRRCSQKAVAPDMSDESPVRNTTPKERAIWGTCPICEAPPGLFCQEKNEKRLLHYSWLVHTARILVAPKTVKLVRVT